jgi:hypothetical protein
MESAAKATGTMGTSRTRESRGLSQLTDSLGSVFGVGQPYLHLGLDPRPHHIGLAGELSAKVLIGLLLALLLQECMVPLWHQLLHLWDVPQHKSGDSFPTWTVQPLHVREPGPPSPTWS